MIGGPKTDRFDPQGPSNSEQSLLWKRWDELVAKANSKEGGMTLAEVDELIVLRDALGLSDKIPLF